MAGKDSTKLLDVEADKHPAALAWSRIDRGKHKPQIIETLKDHKKSKIYRMLEGAPNGWAIIAKRCLSETGKLERVIYEDFLPLAPISQLHYYGYIEENESEVWIFLEDAGEQIFSPEDGEHRILAGHWLGWLHRSARVAGGAEKLPPRESTHYFNLMQIGQKNILQNLKNPALTPEYMDILNCILLQIETLESNWEKLSNWCQDIPKTVVHADFQPKNIRVKQDVTGDVLCVMDWEMAGWGTPIVDIAPSHGNSSSQEVDLPTYLAIAQDFWENLDMPTLLFDLHVGCIFRRLAAIYWSSKELSYKWLDRPVLSMKIYKTELDYALAHIFDAG